MRFNKSRNICRKRPNVQKVDMAEMSLSETNAEADRVVCNGGSDPEGEDAANVERYSHSLRTAICFLELCVCA